MNKIPSLAGFAGSGPGSIGGMNLGVDTTSTVTSQQQGMRHEMDQNSPWHFSSHSHSERSSSHPDLMNWTAGGARGPPQSRVGSWVDSMNPDQPPEDGPRYRGLDQVLAPLESPEMDVPAGTWTNITRDSNLVQHLLALYFCWEYPTFASLSKEHFLKDFQRGRHRYCSPILVNALLSLGCRFSTQPNTRANPNDPYTSGDHFFKESQRLFYMEEDHHRLTTIQALGIMSIREASCGRDSESWYYAGQSIRLAIEMGLHHIHDEGDEDELAVQAATFWGAFALDQYAYLPSYSLTVCLMGFSVHGLWPLAHCLNALVSRIYRRSRQSSTTSRRLYGFPTLMTVSPSSRHHAILV
jgi:Fungal specific transcription factor domain